MTRALTLTLSLTLLAACHGKVSDTPDINTEAVSGFRLVATQYDSALQELRWNPPQSGPTPVGYNLYLSQEPITPATKGSATKFDVPLSLIAPFDPSPKFRLHLPPDSGRVHVAVEARRVDDSIGPLSRNVEMDTTQRIAWIEEDANGALSIAAMAADGSATFEDSLASGSTELAWSPFGGRLAYVKFRWLTTAIFVGDGGPQIAATGETPPAEVLSFRYASDGATVGFTGTQRELALPIGLYVDREPFRIADRVSQPFGGIVKDFAWDSDGERLVYLADGPNPSSEALYKTFPSVGGVRNGALDRIISVVPRAGDRVRVASWSPSGENLAYVLSEAASGQQVLYLAQGREPHANFLFARGRIPVDRSAMQWASDGRTLLFRARLEGEETLDLYALDALTSEVTKVNLPQPRNGAVTDFVVAPSGFGVAFLAHDGRTASRELYVRRSSDQSPRKIDTGLANGETVAEINWALDGRLLGFRIAGPGGSAAGRLGIVDEIGTLIASARDFDVRDGSLAWSPNGKLLTFIGSEATPARSPHHLLVLDAETDDVRRLDPIVSGRRVLTYKWAHLGWRTTRGIEATALDVVPPK